VRTPARPLPTGIGRIGAAGEWYNGVVPGSGRSCHGRHRVEFSADEAVCRVPARRPNLITLGMVEHRARSESAVGEGEVLDVAQRVRTVSARPARQVDNLEFARCLPMGSTRYCARVPE